ncbi:MAG: GFA family protein [Caulobacteraceae bacterium]|nr:GFA family protein [Caulobacteraceae bacterium]
MTEITGGCLCGAVRFRCSAEPLGARVCWCRDCQRFGAGGPTVNVMFPREAVAIEGPLGEFASLADSGNPMRRRFCPTCGVHLFSETDARPQVIVVRAGALDDPEAANPQMTIWTASAPSWAFFHEDLPQAERQAPPIA